MDDNTALGQIVSGSSTPAVSQSGVSIDWSKYELPSHTDRASDVPQASGTAEAKPLTQTPEPNFVKERTPSQNNEVNVQDEDNDADDDTSLPSVTDLRENRFLGPVKNWRAFTREERNVWKAIEIERSRDLAAHLFNAFALEKRAERIRQQQLSAKKGKGIATGSGSPPSALGETQDEEEVAFTPGPSWISWPMPASIVPREGEDMERNADDRFTLTAQPDSRPSANLEHCLMSRMLQVAKERWNSREWEHNKGNHAARESPSKQSQEAQSDQHNGSQLDVFTQAESFDTQLTASSLGAHTDTDDEALSDYSDTDRETPFASTEDTLWPAIQTDDEKSYRILRPTARHILTRVDDLLLALHRARASYMNNDHDRVKIRKRKRKSQATEKEKSSLGIDKGKTETEQNESVPEQEAERARDHRISEPTKKRRARARSAQNKSLALEGEDLRLLSDSEREFTPTESSSSASDSEVSISAENAKHEDQDAGNSGRESMSASQFNSKSHVTRSRADRVGLRDWSDILGTATLTGFPVDAVERASARCARLFGEDMAFRTFEPGRIRKLQGSTVIDETEEGDAETPNFEYTEDLPTAAELGTWKWCRQNMGKRRQKFDPRPAARNRREGAAATSQDSLASLSFTSLSGTQPIVKKVPEHKIMCPVAGCQRAQPGNGFARMWNLNQHISRMHPGMTPVDQGQSSQRMRTRSTSRSVAQEASQLQRYSSIKQEQSQ